MVCLDQSGICLADFFVCGECSNQLLLVGNQSLTIEVSEAYHKAVYEIAEPPRSHVFFIIAGGF
jgi:hypothetical protein